MVRILVLALLTAVCMLSTPATVGYFAWQHQNSGIGWFTAGLVTNDPGYPTTSNVRIEDAKLIVSTDLGGIFEYVLTLGASRPRTSPSQEPGQKWPGTLAQTLVAQTNPSLEYYSREFNPFAACSSNPSCMTTTADGARSTDKIVQATLEYRVVLLDPVWNINLYPGISPFEREYGDSHVYSATIGNGITPLMYTGAAGSSYVNVDLTVPGSEAHVPEPSTAALMLAGIAIAGFGARRLVCRSAKCSREIRQRAF
jgi:hypothetical protein